MPNAFGNKRFREDGKINSILLVDNEHENVAELEKMIRAAAHDRLAEGERIIYVPSPDAAVKEMKERMKTRKGVSAIITDNHFDFDEGTVTIDGQDFLRILYGRLGYCLSHADMDLDLGSFGRFKNFEDLANKILGKTTRARSEHRRNILDFMKRNFQNTERYDGFLEYFTGRVEAPFVLMLCGAPRQIDTTGLEGIDLVSKPLGNCEKNVVNTLRAEGILPDYSLHDHPEDHRHDEVVAADNKYNPRASDIRRYLGKGKRFARKD